LLGACEKHSNVSVDKWAAEQLPGSEPLNDGGYVVLSNIYAAAGMLGEVEMVRTMMSERKVTVPRLQPIALQKRAIEILKVLLSASLLLVQYAVFQSRS
jgi:hypothetical protein